MVLFFSDLLYVKADGSLFHSLAFNGQCEPAFFFPAFHDRHGTAFPSLAFRSDVSRAVFQIGTSCSQQCAGALEFECQQVVGIRHYPSLLVRDFSYDINQGLAVGRDFRTVGC